MSWVDLPLNMRSIPCQLLSEWRTWGRACASTPIVAPLKSCGGVGVSRAKGGACKGRVQIGTRLVFSLVSGDRAAAVVDAAATRMLCLAVGGIGALAPPCDPWRLGVNCLCVLR